MPAASTLITVRKETLDAYQEYVRAAEEDANRNKSSFLWSDGGERAVQVSGGNTLVERFPRQGSSKIPHGLIHDWIGAIHVPGTSLEKTLVLLQDYDHHKSVYHPDVIDSKLLARTGDHFDIYLRLLKKKVITVVLDTWHSVQYGRLGTVRGYCRSSTTRVCEIEHPGSPTELACLPDSGHGFLWRMFSHWKFEERNSGVVIECRVISLTRDIPIGLGWLIAPMVQKLPTESLKSTLESTRRALTNTVPSKAHAGKR